MPRRSGSHGPAAVHLDKKSDKALVEVHAAQVRVAGRGLDVEDGFLDGEQADTKASATEIEDEYVALALQALELVQPARWGTLWGSWRWRDMRQRKARLVVVRGGALQLIDSLV